MSQIIKYTWKEENKTARMYQRSLILLIERYLLEFGYGRNRTVYVNINTDENLYSNNHLYRKPFLFQKLKDECINVIKLDSNEHYSVNPNNLIIFGLRNYGDVNDFHVYAHDIKNKCDCIFELTDLSEYNLSKIVEILMKQKHEM